MCPKPVLFLLGLGFECSAPSGLVRTRQAEQPLERDGEILVSDVCTLEVLPENPIL